MTKRPRPMNFPIHLGVMMILMTNLLSKNLICIVGPTGIGKTALAIELAKKYKTDVISADSRQFYREMNIGTAKPNLDELQSITHHFINSHSIHENYSAGDYERDALSCIHNLLDRKSTRLNSSHVRIS